MPRGCRRSAPPTPASGSCAARSRSSRRRAGARDRELDLLEWELQEIDDAAPSEDEEASLAAERERLRHLESLLAAAAGGVEALAGDEGAGRGASPAPSRVLESVRGVDAGARRAGRPGGRAGGRGRRPGDGAARLRRGRGGDARPPGGGRGAPGAAGPAEAQARRHAGRGARPRRGVPAPPGRARRRRGGARGRPGRARRGARGARAARRRSCARPAPRPRARWPAPCASGSPRWRWTARPSRPR